MGIRGRACECIGMQSMYVLCFRSDREPSTYDVRTTSVTAIVYVVRDRASWRRFVGVLCSSGSD